MVKILVIDDSALMRRIICDIINKEQGYAVEDTSGDGVDAYNKISMNSYDVVVMDMILPKMDGLALLTKLSQDNIKAPVIAVSSSAEDSDLIMQAMEKGAVDFVLKPYLASTEAREEFSEKLIKSIKTVVAAQFNSLLRITPKYSHMSVSRSDSIDSKASSTQTKKADGSSAEPIRATTGFKKFTEEVTPPPAIKGRKIIALACSTGGPQALHKFIPMLPKDLKYPLVLVQHMPKGFTKSLAERLDQVSAIHVKEAEEGEFFESGCVYITPGGYHMQIKENERHEPYAHLDNGPAINSLRPCADIMYHSLATTSFEEIICIVLTGMGADGTEGIDFLRRNKKVYVITQNQDTCVVYGMPKACYQRGLSDEVVPLEKVANSISRRLGG